MTPGASNTVSEGGQNQTPIRGQYLTPIDRPDMSLPNSAARTVHFVNATDQANDALVARQTEEIRPWLWTQPPDTVPENVGRILRHQLFDPLLRHSVIDNPKDTDTLDLWTDRASRIAHRMSRDPWTTQDEILRQEGLQPEELVRLNAAMRDATFVQNLIVRDGLARKYWSTILPLVETGSIHAVVSNQYHFPLRLGIYAGVSCMFYCSFCGRMENPDARYAHADVAPGHSGFDQIFAAMPQGVSTLSLGGGLEPLTNPKLDDVIWSAKRHGHQVPLVTNGFMLTPHYVSRHPGLWDLDVLRISLYGVDEESYYAVTDKRGAFQIVKNNVIEFLKERGRRGSGPRFGFNFIVLVNTTDQVLRVLDLIREINAAVGVETVDFLTLREDFSIPVGDGLTPGERRELLAIFCEFNERRDRECPELGVDFGYALYPLSQGVAREGLAMVAHEGMLPRAYPQVSVAIDLLGDVYLYRDAAFPGRPGAARHIIGTVTETCSLETVVRDFVDGEAEASPQPKDPALMDAFDHVVTKLVWQAQADAATGIPFDAGPIARRVPRSTDASATPIPVNYWQNLFGA